MLCHAAIDITPATFADSASHDAAAATLICRLLAAMPPLLITIIAAFATLREAGMREGYARPFLVFAMPSILRDTCCLQFRAIRY